MRVNALLDEDGTPVSWVGIRESIRLLGAGVGGGCVPTPPIRRTLPSPAPSPSSSFSHTLLWRLLSLGSRMARREVLVLLLLML